MISNSGREIPENKINEFLDYKEFAKTIYKDMIPYDDPDYEDILEKLCDSYADYEINGLTDEQKEELEKLNNELNLNLNKNEIDDNLPF